MGTVRNKTVQEALSYVGSHPPQSFEPTVDMPTWEVVGQLLYLIANSGNPRVRGSVARATRAQKMIWDRKVGRRAPGTHPATIKAEEINFKDLTLGITGGDDE